MGNSIELSIVVTVRDRLNLFRKLIHSVEGQLEGVTDLVVVVDPLQEAAISQVEDCLPQSKKIKLTRGKASGAGPGRNLGVTLATGTHVWFIDSDDALLENSISIIKKEVARLASDVTVFGAAYRKFDSGSSFVPHWLVKRELLNGVERFKPEDLKQSLFQFTTPATWNKIFLKDLIIEKQLSFTDLASSNDVEFTMLSLAEANYIGVSDHLIYEYTLGSPGSLQSSGDTRSLLTAIRSLLRQLESRRKLDLFGESFAQFSKEILIWWTNKSRASILEKGLFGLSFLALLTRVFVMPHVKTLVHKARGRRVL